MVSEKRESDEATELVRQVLATLSGRHLALVGLMGSGKTTIGKGLAEELGLPFHDSDSLIEQASGRSVSKIFADDGEKAFRIMEADTLHGVLAGPTAVIATGGGAFLQLNLRRAIRKSALSVWLRAELNLLDKRTRRRTTRPLLNVDNPKLVLARFIKERHSFYSQANIVVDSEDISKTGMTRRVMEAVAHGQSRAKGNAQ